MDNSRRGQIDELIRKIVSIYESEKKNRSRIDIVYLARQFGFTIYFSSELRGYEEGYLKIDKSNPESTIREIGINVKNTYEQNIFTIAHEIGHYLLHYNIETDPNIVFHKDDIDDCNRDDIEIEADYFAFNLLLNENTISDPNITTFKKFEEKNPYGK